MRKGEVFINDELAGIIYETEEGYFFEMILLLIFCSKTM